MVFPKSNLSSGSVPWGREVQKRIEETDSKLASLAINDRSDTKQLQDSYRRLDITVQKLAEADVKILDAVELATAAAQQAQDAFDATGIVSGEVDAIETDVGTLKTNVYYPGTTTINGGNIRTGTIGATQISSSYVYAGTISAGQISAGNINGVSIVGGSLSTSGSTYVTVSGTSITFNYSGSSVGTLYGSYNASSGKNGIIATTNLFAVMGELGVYNSLLNLSNSSLYSANFGGTLITAGGTFRGASFTGTSFLQSENYASGGTTGASINNNGTIIRTTSSARYKQDIENAVYSYEDVLALQPKSFRLKDEVSDDENARRYAGFIAEEIAGTSLDIFVAYQTLEDGTKQPDGVYYSELTSALLCAIKHQDSLIKSLSDRIEALEGK